MKPNELISKYRIGGVTATGLTCEKVTTTARKRAAGCAPVLSSGSQTGLLDQINRVALLPEQHNPDLQVTTRRIENIQCEDREKCTGVFDIVGAGYHICDDFDE